MNFPAKVFLVFFVPFFVLSATLVKLMTLSAQLFSARFKNASAATKRRLEQFDSKEALRKSQEIYKKSQLAAKTYINQKLRKQSDSADTSYQQNTPNDKA